MTHWHDALTRRLRALVKTAPFHALRAAEGRRAATLPHDDALALAMRALEVLVDALGLRPGASRAELECALVPLLESGDRAAGVPPDRERHRAVILSVVGMLLNDADRRQAYRAEYVDFSDGRAERRVIDFTLASEVEAVDGSVVIRVEKDGINLFLRSLDVDLEDAQAAAEAVIRSQMERGRLDMAARSAREAQVRSIQYAEKVDDVLKRTRRDIGRVDWRSEVPHLVKEARAHLEGRLAAERELLGTVEEQLLVVEEPAQAAALARIREALDDCRSRHLQLHGRLMATFDVFRAEQERQRFAPVALVRLPPLEEGLWVPAARLVARDAVTVTDAFVASARGPSAPAVLDLGVLWDQLLVPPRERTRVGRAVDEDALVAMSPPPPAFPPEVCEAVDRLLVSLEEPRPLSALLSIVARGSEADFLVLRALQHFAPDVHPPLAIRVATTGERLVAPEHTGDDLTLHPEVPDEH